MLFKTLLLLFAPLYVFAIPGYHEPWGKDSALIEKTSSNVMPKAPTRIHGKIAEALILFNQNVISPTYGPRSHFRPTSSRYTLLCMRRYGFVKGFILGCDRLLRENSEDWVYRTRVFNKITYKWEPSYRSRKEALSPSH